MRPTTPNSSAPLRPGAGRCSATTRRAAPGPAGRLRVPGVMGKELLQRGRHGTSGGQGDGLDALAGQIAQQPAAVRAQVGERVARDKSKIESNAGNP